MCKCCLSYCAKYTTDKLNCSVAAIDQIYLFSSPFRLLLKAFHFRVWMNAKVHLNGMNLFTYFKILLTINYSALLDGNRKLFAQGKCYVNTSYTKKGSSYFIDCLFFCFHFNLSQICDVCCSLIINRSTVKSLSRKKINKNKKILCIPVFRFGLLRSWKQETNTIAKNFNLEQQSFDNLSFIIKRKS